MHINQQPVYVLHTRLYRETSLLLECLTRDHGRLGVVARGVRRPRARIQRSDLEPFQRLSMNLSLRGELATLRMAEGQGVSRRLVGDTLLSGLYINELVVRMCARQDVQPGLFESYAQALQRLQSGAGPVAWTLRRFERDLLESSGYALQLHLDADASHALNPQAWYRYLPEHGPQPCPASARGALQGAELLALHADQLPQTDGLRRLRLMMRDVLEFHLGGTKLRAWQMLRPGSANR